MSIYDAAPTLHEALKNAVKEIRDLLDAHDLPNMRFKIEVSGRIQGDLKIEYVLGELYDSGAVVGGSTTAVVEEFMRRRGWTQRNAPLALSYAGEQTEAAE